MSFQGKEFTPEMAQLVVNLKNYFKSEKKAGPTTSTKDPAKRAAEALGVGLATVKRIMAKSVKPFEGQPATPPQKDRGKPAFRLSSNLQPPIRELIRKNNLNGQRIGIEKVREYILVTYQVSIPSTTLWRTLKRWGFVHGTGKKRSTLKEKEHVVLARRKYLRIKRANRKHDGSLIRPEVYIDETFVNKNHSSRFTWYLNKDGPWVNKPSGKGPRLIILHAITKDGWVKDAELVFQAKQQSGDYHGQMNWDNFSKWFTEQLLPNIPPRSLIILDNASYHNTLQDNAFPTSTSSKEQLRRWLTHNNYQWREDMLKSELFDLCKRLAPVPEFQLDKLAEKAGHDILRTPPYHPELQPIETCWAIVKNNLANNCDFTMPGLKQRLPNAFAAVQSSTCKEIIAKVVKQEEIYWKEDGKIEEIGIDEFYVDLDNDDEFDYDIIE
jgi:transposase